MPRTTPDPRTRPTRRRSSSTNWSSPPCREVAARLCLTIPTSSEKICSLGNPEEGASSEGKRHCEVVQRRQGICLHSARDRRRRVRSFFSHPIFGLSLAGGRL